jgi:Peptidase family M23
LSFFILLVHGLMPVALASWLVFGRPPSIVHSTFRMLWVGTFVLTLSVAGTGWLWIGVWMRYASMIVTLFGMAVGFGRAFWRRAPLVVFDTWRQRIDLLIAGGLFAILSSGVRDIASRRLSEGERVTVALPLPSGHYAVVHGGRGQAVNQYAQIHAQQYAVDLVALGSLGTRASGIAPDVNERYFIFDQPVLAPCAGEVTWVQSSLEDHSPQTQAVVKAEDTAGNGIAIACGETTVVMSSLHQGSVTAKAGDKVEKGTIIGRVGSSGASTEPHLHLFATKGRVSDPKALFDTADPAPLTFEPGNFLTRNDQVIVP